jgi:hypothetical protein
MPRLLKGGLLAVSLASAVIAVLPELAEAARARAETKWCLRGPTGSNACLYQTLEQCRKAASGTGGSCMRNPRFGR